MIDKVQVGALTEPVFSGAAEWVEVGPQWPFSFRLRNRSCLFSGPTSYITCK
jgi:hypothetical protein